MVPVKASNKASYSCMCIVTFFVFTTTGGSFQLLDCNPPGGGAKVWYEDTVGCGGTSLPGWGSCVASGIGGGWNCEIGGWWLDKLGYVLARYWVCICDTRNGTLEYARHRMCAWVTEWSSLLLHWGFSSSNSWSRFRFYIHNFIRCGWGSSCTRLFYKCRIINTIQQGLCVVVLWKVYKFIYYQNLRLNGYLISRILSKVAQGCINASLRSQKTAVLSKFPTNIRASWWWVKFSFLSLLPS